jgi:hypothetical protein
MIAPLPRALEVKNHRSFRYDLKKGGSVSQQVWYTKEPSLLKDISASGWSLFNFNIIKKFLSFHRMCIRIH